MSEGGLTLAQVVQQLDGYDDEFMIWAPARTDLADLTPDTEAVVAPQLEDDGVWWAERGLSYVLEMLVEHRPSRQHPYRSPAAMGSQPRRPAYWRRP